MVIEKLIKIREKHRCGESVDGAGWGSIDTGEGDGVWSALERYLNVLKRGMRERERL